MPHAPSCYRCGAPATTREHLPPKSFFPKGGNLQLKTVPSCPEHNNAKSDDDQYLLAHISIHAARGDNLAKKVFVKSIEPQIGRRPAFRDLLTDESIRGGDGAVAYRVDMARFDNFFDHLCHALYFDRYGSPFDDRTHTLGHCYFSLASSDPGERQRMAMLETMLGDFYHRCAAMIERYEADRLGEIVYQNKFIDPAGPAASITIAHTFYGVFEVASLLTRRPLMGAA